MEAILAINAMVEITNVGVRRRIKVYKQRTDPFQLLDIEFRQKYRFTKESVLYIIDLVREDLQKSRRGMVITPELQVLTALRCWGRREYQDDAGDLHGMEQSTVSRVCSRVAHAIARLAPRFIMMPNGMREEEATMRGFKNIANLPTIIGAIDCTHIKIRKTGGDQAQYYINRKGYSSLNVQAVCDAKLRILDLVARWRGSTHDSRIFSESNLKTRFEQGEFRGRLLGDSGYPLLPYLFTPILHPRNIKDERYTKAQIKTRNSIERCFGVLKQRFQCLLFGLTVSIENVKTVIVALSVLHNIAINRNDEIIVMFAGSIANRFGRRTMLIICAIFNTVGWSMVLTVTNFTLLCVAKTIAAQGVSMSFPASIVYLSEVASVEIRGIGITFCVFFINFGLLSMYVMGPLVSYNFISWVAVCSSVINLILSIGMPESPTFFMMREERDKAMKSMKFLKRNMQELEKDKECLEVMLESKSPGYVLAKFREIFFVKRNLKSFTLVAFIYVAQQMSGINAILFNMPKIFGTAGSSIQPHIATIIVGSTQIVACAVAMLMVDWVGRKPLLLVSAGVTAVTNFLMGLNYYWMFKNSSIIEHTKILPLICLITFIIFFTIGFGAVPHSLMGELLDPSIKGLASSIICCIDILFLMLVVSSFEFMNTALGNYGAFWIYASCCVITFIVVLIVVPEGKGKTFGEIQVMLK